MISQFISDKATKDVLDVWARSFEVETEIRQLIEVCGGAGKAKEAVHNYAATNEWNKIVSQMRDEKISNAERNTALIKAVHRREFEKARKAV